MTAARAIFGMASAQVELRALETLTLNPNPNPNPSPNPNQVELRALVDEVRQGCVRYACDGGEQPGFTGELSRLIEAPDTTADPAVAAAAAPTATAPTATTPAAAAPAAEAAATPAAALDAATPAAAAAPTMTAAGAAAAAGAVLRSSSHTATYSRARKNANSPVAPAGPLPEDVRRAAVFR